MLVRPRLLITMIKCLKGHKSLGSLCSVVKTLIVSGARQAPAGSRDISGSRDWTQIPIPGFLKTKSRDFSGFGKAFKTMFLKTFIGFQTTLEYFGDSQNLSKYFKYLL